MRFFPDQSASHSALEVFRLLCRYICAILVMFLVSFLITLLGVIAFDFNLQSFLSGAFLTGHAPRGDANACFALACIAAFAGVLLGSLCFATHRRRLACALLLIIGLFSYDVLWTIDWHPPSPNKHPLHSLTLPLAVGGLCAWFVVELISKRAKRTGTSLPQTSTPQGKKYKRLVWFIPPVALLCAAFGNFLGDMILICAIYGRAAYFDHGLRIAKHKPYTLSSGIVLSDYMDELGWLIDSTLWLGLTILFLYIISGIYSLFQRPPTSAEKINSQITP